MKARKNEQRKRGEKNQKKTKRKKQNTNAPRRTKINESIHEKNQMCKR